MGDFLKSIAPTVASWILGPAGGAAVAAIGSILGISDPTMDKVQKAFEAGKVSPEQLVQIKQLELKAQQDEREMGFKYADLEFKKDALYVEDTDAARRAHASNVGVFKLGLAILFTFAAMMAGVMWGAYKILTGGLQIADPSTIAVVFTFLGTVVGYVAANAQQVVSYFFGSSRGSQDKTAALASAVSQLPQISGK